MAFIRLCIHGARGSVQTISSTYCLFYMKQMYRNTTLRAFVYGIGIPRRSFFHLALMICDALSEPRRQDALILTLRRLIFNNIRFS